MSSCSPSVTLFMSIPVTSAPSAPATGRTSEEVIEPGPPRRHARPGQARNALPTPSSGWRCRRCHGGFRVSRFPFGIGWDNEHVDLGPITRFRARSLASDSDPIELEHAYGVAPQDLVRRFLVETGQKL